MEDFIGSIIFCFIIYLIYRWVKAKKSTTPQIFLHDGTRSVRGSRWSWVNYQGKHLRPGQRQYFPDGSSVKLSRTGRGIYERDSHGNETYVRPARGYNRGHGRYAITKYDRKRI